MAVPWFGTGEERAGVPDVYYQEVKARWSCIYILFPPLCWSLLSQTCVLCFPGDYQSYVVLLFVLIPEAFCHFYIEMVLILQRSPPCLPLSAPSGQADPASTNGHSGLTDLVDN